MAPGDVAVNGNGKSLIEVRAVDVAGAPMSSGSDVEELSPECEQEVPFGEMQEIDNETDSEAEPSSVDQELGEEYEDYVEEEGEEDACVPKDTSAVSPKRTESRIRKLKNANAALAAEVEHLREQLKRARQEPLELRRSKGDSSSKRLSPAMRTVVLRQIIRTHNGRNLEDIASPFRFSEVGAFPHAICDSKRKGRSREYQVESRRIATFSFSLFYDENDEPATERDIKESGNVLMQMKMLYADDYTEVHPCHFTRAAVTHLVTPSVELGSGKTLRNGEVSYSVRFNVQSTETTPRHRPFVMRVGPCKGKEKYNDNLVCYTPPFVIRSKVTAPCSSAIFLASSRDAES